MARMCWTQAEMARQLGIAPASLNKYLADAGSKGKRSPENLAPKLLQLGVSVDWLLTGNGEMFMNSVSYPVEHVENLKRYEMMGRHIEQLLQLFHNNNDRGVQLSPPESAMSGIDTSLPAEQPPLPL